MAGKSDKPPRRGRKVRIDLRKNRGKPARDKGAWSRQLRATDPGADETQGGESVRAKGDLSRKRTIILHDGSTIEATLRQGAVIAMRGLIAEVDDGEKMWACTVRRMLRTRMIDERQAVSVGDRVRFTPVEFEAGRSMATSEAREMPEGVIEEVEPRISTLLRRYERKVQVVAANVDQVIITLAADQPTLRPHLIDRYLVAVHQGGMKPIICINKADLDVTGEAAIVVERYRTIGYRALLTCVTDGRGVDELRQLLANNTSAFMGPSGVGKSSLLNAVEPGFALKIGTLTDLQRGRHTTTTARLLKWQFGGYVVDTPGMRQFELADVAPTELEAYFKEFLALIPNCRYPNCTHRHETGCAVIAAVEAEQITPERYESYCKMYEECAEKPRY